MLYLNTALLSIRSSGSDLNCEKSPLFSIFAFLLSTFFIVCGKCTMLRFFAVVSMILLKLSRDVAKAFKLCGTTKSGGLVWNSLLYFKMMFIMSSYSKMFSVNRLCSSCLCA